MLLSYCRAILELSKYCHHWKRGNRERNVEALEALLTRRSIRSYTEQPVDDKEIDMLLHAAMAAPSAMDEQPWHFVVIRDRKQIERIHAAHPHASMLSQARVVIAVCGDTTKEHYPGYWVVDCSIATTHLLIAAHARELGAVWLGVYPRQERMDMLRDILHLPSHIHPLSLVAIGHPAEQKGPADRFNAERVHKDTW